MSADRIPGIAANVAWTADRYSGSPKLRRSGWNSPVEPSAWGPGARAKRAARARSRLSTPSPDGVGARRRAARTADRGGRRRCRSCGTARGDPRVGSRTADRLPANRRRRGRWRRTWSTSSRSSATSPPPAEPASPLPPARPSRRRSPPVAGRGRRLACRRIVVELLGRPPAARGQRVAHPLQEPGWSVTMRAKTSGPTLPPAPVPCRIGRRTRCQVRPTADAIVAETQPRPVAVLELDDDALVVAARAEQVGGRRPGVLAVTIAERPPSAASAYRRRALASPSSRPSHGAERPGRHGGRGGVRRDDQPRGQLEGESVVGGATFPRHDAVLGAAALRDTGRLDELERERLAADPERSRPSASRP